MRYVACHKCNGTAGTMVSVGDDKYAHQREQDCVDERARRREWDRIMKIRKELVVAKPKLILPR